jgi:hypothetical protein
MTDSPSNLSSASGPSEPGKPQGAPGSEEAKPVYDLAPEENIPYAKPASQSSAGVPASGKPSTGKIDGAKLLDDFDEDADFDHDPEVEQAKRTGGGAGAGIGAPSPKFERPAKKTVVADDATPPDDFSTTEPLVLPGMGDAKTLALIAAGMGLAATIAAAATNRDHPFAAAILTAYLVVLHGGTGVGALAATSYFLDRPLGKVDLAGARMLLSSAVFLFLYNLRIGSNFHLEGILACIGYWLTVWILLRVRPTTVMLIAAFHIALWLAITIGYWLWGWTTSPVPKPGAGG